jgi:anti-sigma regulatory factor (Ser/Thr protein kinase)
MTAEPPKHFVYAIQDDVSSLKDCLKAMEESQAYQDMPSTLQYVAELVLDELVTNTIKYGGPGKHTIECDLKFDGREMEVVLTDDALPFDPWSVPPIAQLETDTVESLVVGGRGIHMLRNATDSRSYERIGGKNVVRVVRAIRPPHNWMKAA